MALEEAWVEKQHELEKKAEWNILAETKPPYRGVLEFQESTDPGPLLGDWVEPLLPYGDWSMFVNFWEGKLGLGGVIPSGAKIHIRVRLGGHRWFPWQVAGLQLRTSHDANWQKAAFAIDHVRNDTGWFSSKPYGNAWLAQLSGYMWDNGGEGPLLPDRFWRGHAARFMNGMRFRIGYTITYRPREIVTPEEGDKIIDFAWTLPKATGS